MPASQLNVKAATLNRPTLRCTSLFRTAHSRPEKRGCSDKPSLRASRAPGPLPRIPSEPSTVLRFKHIPSTATLDYLLDLLHPYGRVLRVQSRKSSQVSTLIVVLMYYSASPIKAAGDLVFVEFEKEEDAVRAKESIERNMEDLFEWKYQKQLATRRARWKGHPPPKPNRWLQIAFVANLQVHQTPPTARILLKLRGLPFGAESAIEIAMRLSQSRVCQ